MLMIVNSTPLRYTHSESYDMRNLSNTLTDVTVWFSRVNLIFLVSLVSAIDMSYPLSLFNMEEL